MNNGGGTGGARRRRLESSARRRDREEERERGKKNRWVHYETIHGYRGEGRDYEISKIRETRWNRWIRGSIRNISSSFRRGERERERKRIQRRAGSSRGRSNFGVKEEIRAINLGCTRRRTREERVEYEIRIAIQRSKRNLDRPFKLLSETSDFGNFTIENLYRVSRKKKEIRSFGLFRYYRTRFILR